MRVLITLSILCIFAAPCVTASASLEAPPGPYLGQREPGTRPEIFAPGIVSLPGRREGNCSFSPDGRTCYFTLVAADGSFATHEMIRRDDGWTTATRAAFANEGNTGDAFIAPSGNKIYFGSTRPPGTPPWNGRIWVADRGSADWGPPQLLDLGIDTDKGIGFPTVSLRGNLYFGSYAEKTSLPNLGKSDIYFVDTTAAKLKPQNAGVPINSPHEEWDPFIAPDESYLLFESDRPGGVGNIDMWVSFRRADGTWGAPVNLGPEVNSPGVDVAAKVSPDGRFLFFERPTRTEQDIYWVSTEVIARLKPR